MMCWSWSARAEGAGQRQSIDVFKRPRLRRGSFKSQVSSLSTVLVAVVVARPAVPASVVLVVATTTAAAE